MPTRNRRRPSSPRSASAARTWCGCRPTRQLVDKMLDMAKVTASDYVMDLGFGRRPHRDHRGQARRDREGHRIQSRHGRAFEEECREGRRHRQGKLRKSRSVRDRFLQGNRDHHVPVAEHQPEAAADPARHEARHPDRVELVRSRRLDRRRDRLDQWRGLHLPLHRLFLAGAGQGRGRRGRPRRAT